MAALDEALVTCDVWRSRLAEGVRPSKDPALAEHVRSCLNCFRMSTELRDVPRVASALRASAEAPELLDPGPGFWDRFSGEIGGAWESQRQVADLGTARKAWTAASAWLRRPWPAALAGAAAAVAIAFTARSLPNLRNARLTGDAQLITDRQEPIEPADDLETAEEEAVEDSAVTNKSGADDVVIAAEEDSPRALTAAEAIEQLEDRDLAQIARALGQTEGR